MADSHKIEPEIYNGVSTLDEPSAAWGWHDIGGRAIQIAGWISVGFLLLMNFGNHHGHVETIWLCSLAALIALGLIIHLVKPTFKNRRTLTAHNKPVGYQERAWNYEQATLSGPFAELSDSQLRALNIDPARVEHLRVAPSTGKHALEN